MGVNNIVTGTEKNISDYNLIDGYKNTVSHVKHATIIGSENNISGEEKDNVESLVLLGDKRNIWALADNSVVIGSSDDTAHSYVTRPDEVIIGHNAYVENHGGNTSGSGDVAIGHNSFIENYVNQSGSIALGQNTHIRNSTGSTENAFILNQYETTKDGNGVTIPTDVAKMNGSIAIGENTFARTGSLMIGTHKYTGEIGDTTVDTSDADSMAKANQQINETVLGTNSFSLGAFSTVTGAYSIISGDYDEKWNNFGSSITGSLNSIESKTATAKNAGVASHIIGTANRMQNTNGAVVLGSGNEITDSNVEMSIPTSNNVSAKDLSEKIRTSIQKDSGGAASVVGNGNEVKKSTNVAVVGSKNSVTSTTNSQIFGDNRIVTGADGAPIDGAVIIGSADQTDPLTTNKKNVTILGYSANATVEGGVAIGAGSVASREAGVAGYDPATKEASGDSSATWKATDAAVSVGKADGTMTRQITGVAAGTKATDAVNVAQLKQVSDGINNNINANKVHYYSVKSKYQDDKSNYNNNGAKGQESIVLGIYSSSDAGYSTVIGMGSSAKKRGTSQASGMYDTVVGQYLDTTGSYNSVFGTFYQNGNESTQQLTQVYGDRNTVLGAGNIVGIGKNNKKVKSDENVVIGVKNSVAGSGSIIVGNATTVNGPATMNATSFGHVNTIYDQQEGGGQWGVALGNNLTVKGEYALAVGNNSTAQGDETVAVGYNANASVAGGAAIGSGSVASVDKGVEGYKPNSSVDTSTDPAGTWKSTDAAVSVGKADGSMTRQITGVAAGTNATDAVNVAQLKQAVAGAKDGNDTLKSDKNALKLDGNTLSMSVKDTAGNEVSGSVELSQIAQAVDTNTTYTLSGQANQDNTTTITLEDNNGKKNSVTVATKDTRNTVKAGENVTLDTRDNADGSHEYTVHVNADGKVEAGSTKIVSGGTVYNETRVAKDGNFVKKSNTAGENLSALDSQVASNASGVTNLNGRVNNLDSKINKVGAGAAALAALHPLDFDPDDKWDFAVGYGNYRDANSAAVGAFYRPDEDTMFSLGTNFGNGENMINAGVSFKFGPKGKSQVRPGSTQEITELRATVARQDDQLKKQDSEIKELKAMVQQLLAAQDKKTATK